jgi:hypothetical protein
MCFCGTERNIPCVIQDLEIFKNVKILQILYLNTNPLRQAS